MEYPFFGFMTSGTDLPDVNFQRCTPCLVYNTAPKSTGFCRPDGGGFDLPQTSGRVTIVKFAIGISLAACRA
jgi:hypothetical protein